MTWEQMELIEATDWEFLDLMEWSIKPDQKSTDAIGLNEFLRKSQILNPLKMIERQHYGKKFMKDDWFTELQHFSAAF